MTECQNKTKIYIIFHSSKEKLSIEKREKYTHILTHKYKKKKKNKINVWIHNERQTTEMPKIRQDMTRAKSAV